MQRSPARVLFQTSSSHPLHEASPPPGAHRSVTYRSLPPHARTRMRALDLLSAPGPPPPPTLLDTHTHPHTRTPAHPPTAIRVLGPQRTAARRYAGWAPRDVSPYLAAPKLGSYPILLPTYFSGRTKVGGGTQSRSHKNHALHGAETISNDHPPTDPPTHHF